MKDICAVVVSFNPQSSLKKNIASLREQVGEIIIVDNGSVELGRTHLTRVQEEFGITVIFNQENLGIANALNTGAKYAMTKGYKWLTTFDQDSFAPPGFISSLMDAYTLCNFQAMVGIVAPIHLNQAVDGTSISQSTELNPSLQIIKTTMTSGNLVKTEVFRSVGFFEDNFFIDYVDVEFCLRLQKYGYKVILCPTTILYHNLGRSRKYVLLGHEFFSTNHDAARRYYMTRNRIAVYKRYTLFDPAWVLSDIYLASVQLLKIALFEHEKRKKLANILRGAYHGIMGRMGRCTL